MEVVPALAVCGTCVSSYRTWPFRYRWLATAVWRRCRAARTAAVVAGCYTSVTTLPLRPEGCKGVGVSGGFIVLFKQNRRKCYLDHVNIICFENILKVNW